MSAGVRDGCSRFTTVSAGRPRIVTYGCRPVKKVSSDEYFRVLPRTLSRDRAETRVCVVPEKIRLAPQITAIDRARLEGWIRARTTPQRTVLRSRLVLLLADGFSAREVARRLGISRHTVDLWRKRFLEEGCETVTRDRPGRGRRPSHAA